MFRASRGHYVHCLWDSSEVSPLPRLPSALPVYAVLISRCEKPDERPRLDRHRVPTACYVTGRKQLLSSCAATDSRGLGAWGPRDPQKVHVPCRVRLIFRLTFIRALGMPRACLASIVTVTTS